MKKLIKKIIALMAAFQLFMDVPVIGLLNVSAAEAFAYQDALIPIEAFATAIAIGSGIVASQSQAAVDGASEMLRKAVARMKAKACFDSETEFRVIDGGKPRRPQKGDDKNNKKWFTIAAGSVATGSLIAGLKASREMMEEINKVNGYKTFSYNKGLVKPGAIYAESNFAYIRAQLANDSKALVHQWDIIGEKIKSTGYDINDYMFFVTTSTVYKTDQNYPDIKFKGYLKNSNADYIELQNVNYEYYPPTNNILYSRYEFKNGYIGQFRNSDDLVTSVKYIAGQLEGSGSWTFDYGSNSIISYHDRYPYRGYNAYGYYPFTHNYYSFTNQVYNDAQSQDVNFPDWLQQSIETINGNLTGLNLAINNLQLPQTWNDTQTNIQTGTAPSNVINQYINNWSNPEQAPDPEPDPGPNPDPDPEPGPGDQPAAEAAVEESGKDLFDWAIKKVTLPDGFFDKLPFSIPYDIYLLLKSLFPSGKSSARRVYSVRSSANVGDMDPNGLTISSKYEASGISTKTHSNKWVKTAPVINLDIHWKYHGVDGKEKTIDIVKKVDLSSISYFAMIIYISIYVFWFFELLSWILSSFKG